MKEEQIRFDNENTPLALIGDVIEKLKELKEKGIKVNTIITSPPYWGQRDYNIAGQIGSEKNPEEYIQNMLKVADALKEVLDEKGSYFLNIGDKYVNKGLQLTPFKLAAEMQSRGWILRNIIVWYKPNHMPSSLKDRLNTIWEPIFFFVKDDGSKYPPKYYANLDEIRIEHKNGNGGEKKTLSIEDFEKLNLPTKPNGKENYSGKFTNVKSINLGASPGARKSQGEYWSLQRKNEITDELKKEIISHLKQKRNEKKISAKEIDEIFGYNDTAGHWFRLDRGGSLPKPEDWNRLKEILELESKYDKHMTEQHYVLQTVTAHPKGKNPGDVWDISLEKLKESHFAVFPTELPKIIIKAFCPKDGIVLDPFAGSGTTGKAAKELGRKSILIEINPEFIKIIEKRCGGIKLI